MSYSKSRVKHSCVYVITNTATNMFYIGSTNDFVIRVSTHKTNLKKGRHCNAHLQASYNKHGIESFEYAVMELCEESEQAEVEQRYLDMYWDYDVLYNINPIAFSCAGRVLSDEHKANISEALLLRYKDIPKKPRVYKLKKDKTPRKWTDEERKRMLELHKGRKCTQEQKDRMSVAQKKVVRTEEANNARAEAQRKRTNYTMSPEKLANLVARSKARKGIKRTPEQCAANSKRRTGMKLSEEALALRRQKMAAKKAAKLVEAHNGSNV